MRAELKWPNDVLVRGHKIAGVLVDGRSRGDRAVAVVSLGVNVESVATLPAEATSLEAERSAVETGSIEAPTAMENESGRGGAHLAGETAGFVEEVEGWIGGSREFAATVDAWRSLTCHREGDRLLVRSSEEVVEGAFVDLDARGRLELRVEGSIRRLSAGVVELPSSEE